MDNEKESVTNIEDDNDSKKKSSKKNLVNLLMGAIKGNKKDLLLLKAKLIIYGVLAAIVAFAIIVETVAEEASAASTYMIEETLTASTSTETATMYKDTGSLILATDEELATISDNYLAELEITNTSFHEALSTKYSGAKPKTVALKVKHIASGANSDATEELKNIEGQEKTATSGATSSEDERTIYEHILRTEKYNFNNVTWRSFVKNASSGVKESTVAYVVDDKSKLIYPNDHSGATNANDLTLEFFINRLRPYLQIWNIPFDVALGTLDAQANSSLNTDFAYEIITSAYHELVMDRYKLENLERKTNYLIYDKTTTTTTTTRTCAKYESSSSETKVTKKAGETCTEAEYEAGLCKDAVREVNCTDTFRLTYVYGCKPGDYKTKINCNDYPTAPGCTYGTLINDKKTTTTKGTTTTYCMDTVGAPEDKVEKDIRESKVGGTKDTDTLKYDWQYVISMAKMLDKVISNEYTFEPYYEYTLDNYNSFISKKDGYDKMTVEEFRESEQTNSYADQFTSEDADYNVTEEPVTDSTNSAWNKDKVVTSIPSGWTKVANTEESKTVNKVTQVTKEGKEYTDTYNWSDTLKYKESKSGIYSLDSVQDVVGEELTDKETEYYTDIFAEKELNLIDLMNAEKDLYNNYTETPYSDKIGIHKNELTMSYSILEKNLKKLATEHPLNGIMYGDSFDIISGLNLGNIAAAGGVNAALVASAESYLGNSLADMESQDVFGIFFQNHWCAMFVSHNLRTVEKALNIQIPIPTYTSCTTFWKGHRYKVGFFDVKEWVDANPDALCRNTNPENIAPLSSIQPGDIILFSYPNSNEYGIRHHTAIVKEVIKDESGNVIDVVTIDGNIGGGYNVSKVTELHYSSSNGNLIKVASFISLSTVLQEYEITGTWGETINGE